MMGGRKSGNDYFIYSRMDYNTHRNDRLSTFRISCN